MAPVWHSNRPFQSWSHDDPGGGGGGCRHRISVSFQPQQLMDPEKENQPPEGCAKVENLQQLKEKVHRLRQLSASHANNVNSSNVPPHNHETSFTTTPLTRLENSWKTNASLETQVSPTISNNCSWKEEKNQIPHPPVKSYPSNGFPVSSNTNSHEKSTYKTQQETTHKASDNSSIKKSDKGNVHTRNKLVQLVRNNPSDPECWLRLLKHVQNEHQIDPQQVSSTMLMQLYEKAVRTIPLKGNRKNDAYIEIWIDYAWLQDKESEHDARGTFKYMRTEHIGEGSPAFLRAWAEFESLHGNEEKAKKLLEEIRLSLGNDCKDSIVERNGTEDRGKTESAPTEENIQAEQDEKLSHHKWNYDVSSSPSKPSANKKKLTSWKTPLLLNSGGARRVSQSLLDDSNCTESYEHQASKQSTTEWQNSLKSGHYTETKGKCTEISHCTTSSLQDSERSATLSKQQQQQHVRPMEQQTPLPSSQKEQPTVKEKVDSPEVLRSASEEARDSAALEISPLVVKEKASRMESSENGIPFDSSPMHYKPQVSISRNNRPSDDKIQSSHVTKVEQQEERRRLEENVPQPAVEEPSPKKDSVFSILSDSRKVILVNKVPYIPLQIVGRGGSSKVFKVMNSNGQIFALKRVRVSQADEQGKSIFLNYQNEISLLQRLKGKPCIIQLIDSEVNAKTLTVHFILEYGDIDLSRLLTRYAERQKSVDLNFVRLYWQQMLEAVQTIHEEKIIHSDLKPANFLFVEGTLKLIDFGIAKASQSETTKVFHDSPMGTLNFMSPEAFSDNCRLGRASDVWSLGCILYQMVYGKTPYAHLNPIMKMRIIPDPKYPVEFPNKSHLNPHLLDVLSRCLQKDANKRASIPELLNHTFLHPDRLYSK